MSTDQAARVARVVGAWSVHRARSEPPRLRQLAPAARALDLLALAVGLPPPPVGVRSAAAEVMEEIVKERELPEDPQARDAILRELLQPMMDAAVAARREAQDEHAQATTVLERLRDARAAGEDQRLQALLEGAAERLLTHAAEMLIVAHLRSEEARGAARTVRLVRRGRVCPAADSRSRTDRGR